MIKIVVFCKVSTRESIPQNIFSWEETYEMKRASYQRDMGRIRQIKAFGCGKADLAVMVGFVSRHLLTMHCSIRRPFVQKAKSVIKMAWTWLRRTSRDSWWSFRKKFYGVFWGVKQMLVDDTILKYFKMYMVSPL